MWFTSCRTPIFAQLKYPSSVHLKLPSGLSTKTIAALDEDQLHVGQMQEVAFGEGNILLSRLGEKIHATSAFCTHYGAPLAKGVLAYSDGRVVIPGMEHALMYALVISRMLLLPWLSTLSRRTLLMGKFMSQSLLILRPRLLVLT
ncbi:hypothetical protein K443DRAFT_138186 [Laccaria amethystina LaAM-08-1]|uniref:Rieske domain-containing protein n=1 Tax=Laccaria amethystina LaAM-08-1 TaxID=1095629 RepID=A0A0C9YPW8_9AGAR|nr:hypothetical protein K443DRAFT_138186 [Laccaria amethystina LaAM-08-1]